MTFQQGFWKFIKKFSKIKDHDLDSKSTELSQMINETDQQPPKQASDSTGPIIRKEKQKVHLQVGLDFGTSSTKIVYSQLGRRLSRAIIFNHNLPNFPQYCLPSIAAINNDGKLLLGIEAAKHLSDKEWDLGIQRLKVIVASNYDPIFRDNETVNNFNRYLEKNGVRDKLSAEKLMAVYLAYAMKKTREIIRATKEYKGAKLDIAFNICVPIDHLENNRVKSAFKKVFKWAETIERQWSMTPQNFNPLKASYSLKNSSPSKETRVFAVPEAVAAMASYLVSLRKEEGLHAFIDFGAGTTDISICNLRMPFGESKSYWYSTKNIPRGTVNIERIIASFIRESKIDSPCTGKDIYSCLNSIMYGGKISDNLLTKEQKLRDSILNELNKLWESTEYYQTWGNAWTRYHGESLWEKVEIFVCGGGSHLPGVDKIFSRPWYPGLKVRYPVSELPVPEDYDPGESEAPFERMAVAYGLARPVPELGEYVLPGGVGDHTPPPLPVSKRDRDELYPK
jgi:hypothetical protein